MALNIQSVLWAENYNLWNADPNNWNFGSSDADSYSNVVYENVIEPLQDIINTEFNIPIFDEHRGNQSFVIDPQEDTLIEYFASGQSRSYDISIIYTLQQGGGFYKVRKNLTNTTEHLKRLIHNNSNYSSSGVQKFYDGKIESVEYEQDEDSLNIWRSNMLFNCVVMEQY